MSPIARKHIFNGDKCQRRRFIAGIAVALLLTALLAAGGCAQTSTPAPAPPKTSAPAATTAATSAQAEAAKPIELSLSSLFPPVSEQQKYLLQWADKIKADSNGRLTIRIYGGATLTSAADAYPGLVKGVSDMATGFKYAYEKDIGMVLPVFLFGVPDAKACSLIYNEIYNEFPEYKTEWSEVKILWFSGGGPNNIHPTRKPVNVLDDLKGLQLRTDGKMQGESLVALGAIPVDVSTADLFSALQKGTVAGAVGTDDQLTSRKLADVVNYTIDFGVYSSIANFMAINSDKYNSLSPDLRKVLDNSADWGRNKAMECWMKGNQDGVDYAKTKGHTFIKLAPAEQEKWQSILLNQQGKVAAGMDAKGLPGTKVLKFVQDRIKFYSAK